MTGTEPTTPTHVGTVVNPAAGGGRAEELSAALASAFPDATVDSTTTRGPQDVPRATREQADGDLLVVVGGDGTLREVASTLFEDTSVSEPPPLFAVPAGRGNSMYRHVWGDAHWRSVARELARGIEARPLDLGRVAGDAFDERYFLLGFTAGLFRHALDAAEYVRALPGPLAYVFGTTHAALATDPVQVLVTGSLDDNPAGSTTGTTAKELYGGPARLVAVGGGRYRGSAFDLLPEARVGDGRLHLLVVEPTAARTALQIGRLARDGVHIAHPAVHYHTGTRFEVVAPGGLPAETDGTPLSDSPQAVELTVNPGVLRAAVPPGWNP